MPTLTEMLAEDALALDTGRRTPGDLAQPIALPSADSGSVGLFFLSPELERRISRMAQVRAMSAGELIARALDALDKESR